MAACFCAELVAAWALIGKSQHLLVYRWGSLRGMGCLLFPLDKKRNRDAL